jgi:hypothetical protein
MTQIKLFTEKTPELEKIEKQVNAFLKDNDGKILVKDIKYTAESPNPNNSLWKNWTVMIIYETN